MARRAACRAIRATSRRPQRSRHPSYIRHLGNAHVCGPGRPVGYALHGVRRGAAAFEAPGSRTGSGPPRCRPQRMPRCRDPQPPEPMARPAAHTPLPGCSHVVGHLAVDAILRNRSWLPRSRLRQSLHRSSLQNPRLPGSPARRAPPDRRTRQTASGFPCPWGCIHLPVRLASARRRTQPPSPSCPLGRWTDRSGHGRRRERPARPEPVA